MTINKSKMKLKTLLAKPTLHQGHTDDLKIETKNRRVWLSRLTIEDGMPYNNQVAVEEFNHIKGQWETIKTYEAR